MDMDWKTRLAEIKAETKRLRALNEASAECAKRMDALLAEDDLPMMDDVRQEREPQERKEQEARARFENQVMVDFEPVTDPDFLEEIKWMKIKRQ